MTTEQEQTQAPSAEQEAVAQAPRAPRQRWFSAFPTGSLAVLSGTCTGIGLGSLGLERLAMFVTRGEPFGTLVGLPWPFISAPLGIGATLLAALVAFSSPKMAIWPGLLALSYWALTAFLWP